MTDMLKQTPVNLGGRPSRIYGMDRPTFATFWTVSEKTSKPDLTEGFTQVAYVTKGVDAHSKTPLQSYRVILWPTLGNSEFFWVRIETPDKKLEFSVPAVVSRADVPRLLELWEVFDGKDTAWFPGTPAQPYYPATWNMPYAYTVEKRHFTAIAYDVEARKHTLVDRAGLHTMRALDKTLAGIVGHTADRNDLRPLYACGAAFPIGSGAMTEKLLMAAWEASAAYFRRVLLDHRDPGRLNPFIPHAELLGIPKASISGFVP